MPIIALAVVTAMQRAAGAATVSDNFNRADGAMGSNWSTIAGTAAPKIANGVLTAGTANTVNSARWSATTFSGDQYAQATLPNSGGTQFGPGIAVRLANSRGYFLWYGNQSNHVSIWRMDTKTSRTQLKASGALTISPSDAWQIQAVGSTISGYQNGKLVVQVTDTRYTTGSPGVWLYYSNNQISNWSGGDVSGGTPPPPATYSVGGTVSGLSGSVSLQDNGGDTLAVSANGSFAFATQLASGAAYSVSVSSSPAGQTCTVANGSGTVGSSNVTNVSVTCANNPPSGGVSDDFNRANGPLGTGWTDMSEGGLVISGQAVAGGNTANSGDIRTGETYDSDQWSTVQVTPTQLSGGQWIGPSVRSQNGGLSDYAGIYYWNYGSPELMLFRRVSGAWTQLGQSYSTSGLPAGTTLELDASGSAITFKLNGAAVIAATDTTLTAGAPGIISFGTGQVDNWSGGDVSGGTPPPPPPPATYSVGGTVSGLSGSVSLQDNGGDTLAVSANGSFAFATQLASGAAYSVSVSSSPAGQTCTVANGSGTVGSANVTNVSVTCANSSSGGGSTGGGSGLTVNYAGTDANGVATYTTTSAINGGVSEPLRVLNPTSPAPGVAHNFLIALPVEPGTGTTYGDAMSTLEALNAQNQYNLTIIEPSFEIDPWYADSATDPAEQQETFMTTQLVPWIKANLATTGTEQTWLLGFSKSGLGAQDLILKHPDVYTLAASWDGPFDMVSYDQLGSSPATAYGTDANYQNNYNLTNSFISARMAPFTVHKRLWIGGYYYFDWDVTDYAARLASLGVLRDAPTPVQMAHRWDSGWVPGALAALAADSVNQ